jgi:hypothetical protein
VGVFLARDLADNVSNGIWCLAARDKPFSVDKAVSAGKTVIEDQRVKQTGGKKAKLGR